MKYTDLCAQAEAWAKEERDERGGYTSGEAKILVSMIAAIRELEAERDAVEALVKAAAQDAREVFEGCGSKAREAIDYMEQVALAAIRAGATP